MSAVICITNHHVFMSHQELHRNNCILLIYYRLSCIHSSIQCDVNKVQKQKSIEKLIHPQNVLK